MNDWQSETLDRYQRGRARSRELFDLLTDEAYYSQPIALRHPIVFYEGHLPGFSFNTLIKKALACPSIDARLEDLFARGIDPDESSAGQRSTASPESLWPSRATVRAFAADADQQIEDALLNGELDRPGQPLLDRTEATFCILEHEATHHETLLYMWHRLPFELKRRPPGYRPRTEGTSPGVEWINVPPGRGSLLMVTGSPGGPTIINTVMHSILNVIEHGMTVHEAVAYPRFHHQWMPDSVRWEPRGLSRDTRSLLESMGHTLVTRGRMGSCHAILIGRDGKRLAGVDPRISGAGASGTD